MSFFGDLLTGAFGYGLPNVQRTQEVEEQRLARRRGLSDTELQYLSALAQGDDIGADRLRDALASELREYNEVRQESDGETPIALGQYLDNLHRVIDADRQDEARLRRANALPGWTLPSADQALTRRPRDGVNDRARRSPARGLLASQLRNR